MNRDFDEYQAQRLKQILFPKKTKTSASIQSSLDSIKQNQEINHKYTIKQQINKLKQGIRNFMGKNTLQDNLLSTPRQCLELIKCMSERMINYNQQIQQAVYTLIQSIPKPLSKPYHTSKYFLVFLKINHLNNVLYRKRRANISEGFDSIKKYSQNQKIMYEREHEKFLKSQFHRQIFIRNKVHMVFNRWRKNVTLARKTQTQNYYHELHIERSLRTLQMLSDQGKMVLYLQRIIDSNADFVEIILYNSKNSTLRSYKLENQSLTSVFQSIHNESQISNLDESIQVLNGKIKRLDIDLEHSLTKICIIKKQTLKIEDLRKDPDYSKIDDYTPVYGLSSRQCTGGCIFTPIISKNMCIGVIRQYYYSRLGQPPHPDTVSQIGQTLQYCIKTHNTFEIAKQKSLAIRNNYYLKAIIILNEIQRIDQFSRKKQEQLMSKISSFFPLQLICEHQYQVAKNNVDKPSHFTIKSTKSDHNISSIVVSLSKMSQNETYYLYEQNILYIIVNSKIFVFEVKKQKDNKNEPSKIPVEIIYKLLERKQQIKQQKEKQKQELIKQKERKQEQRQNKRVLTIKNSILNFFLTSNNICDQVQLSSLLIKYIEIFIKGQIYGNLDFKLKINNKLKDKIKGYSDESIKIYEDQSTYIHIQTNNANKLTIPQYILNPLVDFTSYMVKKLKNPSSLPCTDTLNLKSEIHFDSKNLQKSMVNLIKDWLSLSENKIKWIITKQNPFVPQSYYCFLQKQLIGEQFGQKIIKEIKNSSTQHPSTLNPINSIIYINNQLLIIIDKYLGLNEQLLNILSSIYSRWQTQRDTLKMLKNNIQKQTKITKAGFILERVICTKKLRPVFWKIKNSNKKINYLPNLLQNFIFKQNRVVSSYAFNLMRISLTQSKRSMVSSYKLETNLKCIIRGLYKLANTQKFFTQMKKQKDIYKKLHRLNSTLNGKILLILNDGFHNLNIRRYIKNTNKLSNLEALFKTKLYQGFENIRRWSKQKQSLEIIESQTQCSMISKLDSLNSVCKIIRERFQKYQVYLYLKNGLYLSLTLPNGVQTSEQLKDKSGFQYYQFNTQTKRIVKNIVWLVPETVTITLVEKHFLQVLSRAIQQSFSKFIYRSYEFLSIINHFSNVKNTNLMNNALNNLRNFSMSQIKAQQYKWRDSYYQSSVEVENFKIIERQQRIQQQQRMQQISQVLQTKKQYEQELAECRKTIVRLDISSRHLEQAQTREKYKNQRRQKVRAFMIWRTQTAYHKKYVKRRQLARKRQQFTTSNLFKLIKSKYYQNLQFCLKMIMIQSANVRAKARSAQKKNLLETKDFNKNRLLTFQDELNQFGQDINDHSRTLLNMELSPNKNKQVDEKQLSIIPISFKHFESSKKQNYDVTDEQARKLNGGVYKLNAKTLKFLKRMGKLNN